MYLIKYNVIVIKWNELNEEVKKMKRVILWSLVKRILVKAFLQITICLINQLIANIILSALIGTTFIEGFQTLWYTYKHKASKSSKT